MDTWRFAVLGPGGVGGLLGAVLARGGHDVVFIARPGTAEAISEGGVELHSGQFGDFAVPARAATSLDEPVDAVLVTPKATALEAALERVPPEALGDALVVPFLNGADHVALLRDRYPADQVVPATIQVEAFRTAPGRFEHRSPFSRIAVAAGPRSAALVDALTAGGLDARLGGDETALLWDKLIVLAPMALLTTAAAAPVGTIRVERRQELVAVLGEITAVAAALGATLDPDRTLALIDSVPAGMRTSMQRDAEAGVPIELDAIGGAILRAADRTGVPVPVTQALVAELRDR
jgi:2-dehydropantoate 2-reductase